MPRKAPLVVAGDAPLDRDLAGTVERLAPDAPVPVIADRAQRTRPGGAALTAYLAARDGREATLITLPTDAVDARDLVGRVRADGGTVVAEGGCFDVLPAGHVGLLQAARRLGDCLVVRVDSESSVRRRKGRDRPVNPLSDRVRVLDALSCVDAVAVSDDDTPERLPAGLCPEIWVKGGDYSGADLPEAALLQEWNGQAVPPPCLDGRSSTVIVAGAGKRAQAGKAAR
ncbi:adenylyltransferase/cytidyltransferase family protein [Streptomyces sp. NRRL WC-3618]|uniref:adenylyltransferase/cytidyltransferase family protein n=1 Tax=Streptomyces sp. NRRL WC-3618 TaxID=1519490 RepID=UPI000AC1AA5A